MSDNESENIVETGLQGNSFDENDFKSAMLKMMSDFKTDILANVQESVAQVYHDFGYNEDANSGDEGIQQGANIVSQIAQFTEESHKASNFESLASQFIGGEKAGPPIDKVLSNIMQSLVNEKLPKEKLDALQRDYLRPENCPDLVAPKINKQIWQQLKQDTKNRDSSLQKIQATLMSSLYAMLQVCNNLASSQQDKENLTSLTHAAILLMSANRDFNLKRRELIHRDLNKQYAALCSPTVPVSSFLFGDDLNKEVEDLTKANRLGNKVTPKQRVGPYQFQRGHVFRGAARGFRALDRGKQTNWKGRGPFLGAGRGLSRNYQNCQSYQNKQQQ